MAIADRNALDYTETLLFKVMFFSGEVFIFD